MSSDGKSRGPLDPNRSPEYSVATSGDEPERTIADLHDWFLDLTDDREVYELLVELIMERSGAASAAVFGCDEDGDYLRGGFCRNPEGEQADIERVRFSLEDHTLRPVGILEDDARNGGGSEDPMELEPFLGAKPWTYVALRGSGAALAVFCVSNAPEPGTEARWFMDHACRWAGSALERCWTTTWVDRAEKQLDGWSELTASIAQANSLHDLLPAASRILMRTTGADWCRAWLADGAEETLRAAGSVGVFRDDAEFESWLSDEAKKTLQASSGRETRREAEVTQTVYLQPIRSGDRLHGVLALDGSRLTRTEQRFLERASQQISAAIREARWVEQLRQAEQRLRETQAMLLQAERMANLGEDVIDFASQIATPLETIREQARILAESIPEDQEENTASLMFRELVRVESLLKEQLARSEVRGRPRLEVVDFSKLVGKVIENERGATDGKGVRLETEHEPGLPEILLDAEKVTQVLHNIIQNTLEPLDRGERMNVRTFREGNHLGVEIATDGGALVGDVLDRLFVPFANPRPGGQGLGLAVARQIVVDHGGEIDVRSGDPWTVIFTVRFPIQENQDRRRSNDRRRKDRRNAA